MRYPEAELADKLQVSRGVLRRLRLAMRRPWDWRHSARGIVFTERGLGILCEKLGIKMEDLNLPVPVLANQNPLPKGYGDDEARESTPTNRIIGSNVRSGTEMPVGNSRGGQIPLVHQMTVTRVYDNVKMLLAKDENEKRWEVIVGDNRNFMIGMKFEAVPAPANPGYLKYLGKLPRTRGKW